MNNILSENVYIDKVRACWVGKNIGGTLGMPFEGVERQLNLTFYDPVPGRPQPNDDLDFQLLWLTLVEQFGLSLGYKHLTEAWREHVEYGMDEYGVAIWNIRRGLEPPLTGIHNNWFVNGMGAAIRSEIWACLFPGRPENAAYFAQLDASVDHAGEGVWAEMFLAAAESMAFVAPGPAEAITKGLSVIPKDCRVTNVIRFVIDEFDKGTVPSEARNKILAEFGSHNFTDCVMNLGFVALGLIYGQNNFEKSLLLSVNCGMDTDCTAATTGAFMGIMGGTDSIPHRWSLPLKDQITCTSFRELDVPEDISEMTERTVKLSKKLICEINENPPSLSRVECVCDTVDDGYTWLIFSGDSDISDELAQLTEGERNIEDGINHHAVRFAGIHMDLSRYCKPPAGFMYLLTHLSVPEDIECFLMLCADTGMTAWLNDKMILNYHGRKRALPASHRTEGGASVPVSLLADRSYELKIRLLNCHAPLTLTAAVLDEFNQYVPGFDFKARI